MTIAEQSYARHREHFKTSVDDPELARVRDSWLRNDTIGTADGNRLGYELGAFFGRGDYSVVTIGDGRMGLDAIKLKAFGAKKVLPTDISPYLLEHGKARGLIDDYSVENVEHLSFADNQFDFAFCREAYHHFPRPWMGVYEMLRVSRKGIVLVEPQDQQGTVYHLVKRLKDGKGRMNGDYEEAGNFVYRLNLRELCKVGLGMNLPMIAVKGTVAGYVGGVEFEPIGSRSKVALRYWLNHWARTLAWTFGLIRAPVLMAMLLKEPLAANERAELQALGWRMIDFSRNPHLGG